MLPFMHNANKFLYSKTDVKTARQIYLKTVIRRKYNTPPQVTTPKLLMFCFPIYPQAK